MESSNKFTIHDALHLALANWYWFLLSLALCIGIALLYLACRTPLYERSATVLVKDSRKGSGSDVTAFDDIIGGVGGRSVDNELHIFKSRQIMEQVAKKYDLTTRYLTTQGLRTIDL